MNVAYFQLLRNWKPLEINKFYAFPREHLSILLVFSPHNTILIGWSPLGIIHLVHKQNFSKT